jgi:hypothetical protein
VQSQFESIYASSLATLATVLLFTTITFMNDYQRN